MNKTIEVIKIEEYYNIKLTQILIEEWDYENSNKNKNCFVLNVDNKIVYLNLSNNLISDASILNSFESLEYIDLGFNKLNTIPDFSNLKKLKVLSLHRNNISKIENLENCKELKELFLGLNKISKIEGLDSLVNLKKLYLFNNKIKKVENLKNNTSLEVLSLRGNLIFDLPNTEDVKAILFWAKNKNKPNQIIILQEYYDIEIEQIEYSDFSIYSAINSYSINSENKIIALNICNKKIIDVSVIFTLLDLVKLSLRFNNIEDIALIKNLKSLTHLDVSFNNISNITSIKDLKKLEDINIGFNRISSINILFGNEKLKAIGANSNLINSIDGISKLKNLTSLSISNNPIDNINALKGLKSLNYLSLNNINANDFSVLKAFENLYFLHLSKNSISDLSFLNKLTNLSYLTLANNNISSLKPLSKLIKLVSLDVSKNLIDDLEPIFRIETLTKVEFESNPIIYSESIPEEDIKAGWESVKNYLIETKIVDVYEIKVLLLGNTKAGKSSLLEALETEEASKILEEDRTHGIVYKKLKIRGSKINFHVWDFGGQEYYHATHKLFFSPNALNVVVWCRENDDTENWDLNYWLRSIDQLNGHSDSMEEVIIIENKIDKNNYYPISPLKLKYDIAFEEKLKISFFAVSLYPELKRFNSVKDILIEKANESFLIKEKRSERFAKSLNYVIKSKAKFLDITNANVKKATRISDLKVIHNMGIIVYFDSIIPDKVFNKPDLLLNFIYDNILYDKKKYTINENEIEEILLRSNDLKLTPQNVIDLLKEFDLVFQINGVGDFFIPQYLPSKPVWLDFIERYEFSNISIRIQSDAYLMNLVLLKLFSLYGSSIKRDNNDFLFWRNGMIIEEENQILFISFNRELQTINLLNRVSDDNYSLQKKVVDNLLFNLSKNDKNDLEIKNINPIIEWSDNKFLKIQVTHNGVDFANWKDLQSSKSPTFYSNNSLFNKRDFRKFLSKDTMAKRVFISYSKDDLTIVNSYIKSLSSLVLEGLIEEPWYCTYLSPGDEVHNKIRDKMEQAEIICFMCSNNFFKTKYIIDHELKPTLLRKRNGGNQLILPIIIDRTKWIFDNQEINLGNYAGFPYRGKPVSDFKNWDDAWYVINWFLEQVIKNNRQYNNTDNEWDDLDLSINNLSPDVNDLLQRQIKGKLDI